MPSPSAARKLRINWILPEAGLAGGVKSNRLIAEAMVRRGHDVTLAYVERRKPWPSPLHIRQFTQRLVHWRGRPRSHHLLQSTARLIAVHGGKITSDNVPDADVTIGTWWETVNWIQDWPQSKGIKAHFIRHYETFGGSPEQVDAVYRLPTQKFVIAKWLKRLMTEKFNQESILVPNGVDWTQFGSVPRGKSITPTVGVMYSRVTWKDIQTAMEAIRIARQTIRDLRVVSFGSRPPGLLPIPAADFEFHLCPAQERIADLYRRVDCWLLSSRSEGFGMPGLEAAACRCPVISTRCGGPEDYVKDGESGYLVSVGNPKEMAQRIVDVLTLEDDHWRAMSEASYAIARNFDWDDSARTLEQALVNAL